MYNLLMNFEINWHTCHKSNSNGGHLTDFVVVVENILICLTTKCMQGRNNDWKGSHSQIDDILINKNGLIGQCNVKFTILRIIQLYLQNSILAC